MVALAKFNTAVQGRMFGDRAGVPIASHGIACPTCLRICVSDKGALGPR